MFSVLRSHSAVYFNIDVNIFYDWLNNNEERQLVIISMLEYTAE